MKNFRFLVPIFLFWAIACGKKTTETTTVAVKPMPNTTSPSKPQPTVQTPSADMIPKATTPNVKLNIPEGVDPNLVVSLKRTPCFGKCPTFEMMLYADGRAVYHGQSNVEKIGNYETKVSADFMKAILAQAQEIKYMSLSNKYPMSNVDISDVPTTTSYVRIGNDGKMIINNHDAPTQLIDFERFVEAQFFNLNWGKAKN